MCNVIQVSIVMLLIKHIKIKLLFSTIWYKLKLLCVHLIIYWGTDRGKENDIKYVFLQLFMLAFKWNFKNKIE